MKDAIDIAFEKAQSNATGNTLYVLWNSELMEDRKLRMHDPNASATDRAVASEIGPDRAIAIVVPDHMERMMDTRIRDDVMRAFNNELERVMGTKNANRVMVSWFTRSTIDHFNEERRKNGAEAIDIRSEMATHDME